MLSRDEIYEKLRKEHYFFCQGKSPKILKAACEYVAGILNPKQSQTRREVADKYETSLASIQNYSLLILFMLGYDPFTEDPSMICNNYRQCPYYRYYQRHKKDELKKRL